MTEKKADMLEDNENQTTKGKNEVYKDPPGHASAGTWGSTPKPEPAHGTAVLEAAKDGRLGMIDRLFDSPATSAPAEQNALKEYFNAKTVEEAHTPHSPLLQRGKAEKTAEDETLTDKVNRIVGFR